MKILFAHGFEGSATGTKPRYLRDTLGHTVIAPTMYGLGWTFEGHVQSVLQVLDSEPDIDAIVGSSMGGFASAVALSRRPELPVVAALLAPAVGIHESLVQEYGDAAMKRWAEEGTKPYWHRGLEVHIDLPYAFWTGCRDAANVEVTHPCIILHGINDSIVPLERSVKLAARSPGVSQLIKTDDGHRLTESLHHLGPMLRLLTDTPN